VLQLGQLLRGEDGLDLGQRAGHPLDDDELVHFARIRDEDLHHEAVDLRFR
jgi:hypothetical protein